MNRMVSRRFSFCVESHVVEDSMQTDTKPQDVLSQLRMKILKDPCLGTVNIRVSAKSV